MVVEIVSAENKTKIDSLAIYSQVVPAIVHASKRDSSNNARVTAALIVSGVSVTAANISSVFVVKGQLNGVVSLYLDKEELADLITNLQYIHMKMED